VLALAGLSGGALTLILAGVAVTSLTGALTSLALNLSDNPFAATEIIFWLLGSLKDRSLSHVALAGPLIVSGLALLLTAGRALEALSLGEDAAASLGIDLARTRHLVLAGTALSVGGATAVTGTVGFVGLVVPHLLRPWVGQSPARLLPASLLGGALLVLVADIVVRHVTAIDLRLGVLTALIGAPFFLWLVLAKRRELAP
jgi:iron complex transport system permease protein